MSEYTIDVNIGTRSVRNILTERTTPALQKEQKWLKAAWEKFDSLPDDHKMPVGTMRALLERNKAYVAALGSAYRAGMDNAELDTEQLNF